MKAQIYILQVSDSILDSVHGQYYYLKEVYIPELNLVINNRYSFLVTDDSRVKTCKNVNVKEIELDIQTQEHCILLKETLVWKEEHEKFLRNKFNLDEKITQEEKPNGTI